VLFWIHGGGFVGDDNSGNGIGLGVGSGQDIADAENIIVVRVSYRLGVLGGLVDSVFGPNAGDYGIEDQTAALRWVHVNVAEFGGNPGNVTIDGQSAGAASVCGQIFSPQARGLFEKAIVESGTWNSARNGSNCLQLNTPAQVAAVAQEVQQDLGCTSGDIATCLRNAPYSAIRSLPIPPIAPPFPYFPVLNSTFLPIQYSTALRTGQFNHVRVIVGNAQNDFGYPPNPSTTWASFAQDMQTAWGPAAAQRILAVYSAANYPNAGVAEGDTLSDQFFCEANTFTSDLSRWVTAYEYRYDDGTEPFYGGVTNLLAGAFHSSELPALFPGWNNEPMIGPDQQAMTQTMQTYWGSFARSGQLSGQGALPWPPYNNHMHGDGHGGVIMSLLQAYDSELLTSSVLDATHNCSIWDSLPN
jgi:para-nitrobenzyl esterase